MRRLRLASRPEWEGYGFGGGGGVVTCLMSIFEKWPFRITICDTLFHPFHLSNVKRKLYRPNYVAGNSF